MAAYRWVYDYACVLLWAWWKMVAAHHRVHDYACCHLQADCRVRYQLHSPTLDLCVWDFTYLWFFRCQVVLTHVGTKPVNPDLEVPSICIPWCVSAVSKTIDICLSQLPTPGPPKKRKKLGDLGCQGAYFMPTETRSLALGRLTKASVVETHVGSLRPVGNENTGCNTKHFTYLFQIFSGLWKDVELFNSTALFGFMLSMTVYPAFPQGAWNSRLGRVGK